MPSFRYKAVDGTGTVITGSASALDEHEVERELERRGLTLIDYRMLKKGRLSRWFGEAIKPRAIAEFYHRLSQTLEIGLPVLAALEENSRYLPSRSMRHISGEIKTSVEGGRTLYEAMSAQTNVFAKLDLAIVRMGEQTGVLPLCLKQLAAFLEWKSSLRAHVRRATIYPAFVVTAIVAVLAVWVGYVLPQMITALQEMGIAIPQATLMVLAVSEWVKANAVVILAILVCGITAIYLYQRTYRGGLRFDRLLLGLPLLGRVLHNIALTRLCHNFATMFGAGMAIQQIFNALSDNGLGNRYLEERLAYALKVIESGESIAAALEIAGGFPSLLIGAVRNGETTGTLDQSFKRLGDYFDEEVKQTVQALLSAIEPMAILALGAVFGLIVLSILMPLYDVMGTMGNAY